MDEQFPQSACPLDGSELQTYCFVHDHLNTDPKYVCPFKDECQQMREDYERSRENLVG